MNLKRLTGDVKKIGRFKDAKEARAAINSVFISTRQRNILENAGSVTSVFKSSFRKAVERKDPYSGASNFLFGKGSQLSRINLANFKVRIQRAHEGVCDSDGVLKAVFGGIKAQLTPQQIEKIAEKMSDAALVKAWKNA